MAEPRRLAQGRRRRQQESARASVARVRRYQAWLRAGSRLRDIPTIPSDADYAVARRLGKV
jgi:hypothetical protein